MLVGGHPELGIQPVEGLLGVADGVALEVAVGVAELVGQAGVVVAVAGVKVAAEAVGDLVDRLVAELVAAEGGRGLQVRQQLRAAVLGVAVLLLADLWRRGWGGVYVEHYNRHRPHRSLGHMAPVPSVPREPRSGPILDGLRRRDLLGGLIHEYEPAA